MSNVHIAKLDASFQKLLQALATLHDSTQQQQQQQKSTASTTTTTTTTATENVASALDELERHLTQLQLEFASDVDRR